MYTVIYRSVDRPNNNYESVSDIVDNLRVYNSHVYIVIYMCMVFYMFRYMPLVGIEGLRTVFK